MPYPSLKNRVVLITGGARGLGLAMALALVEAGASVFIVSRSRIQIDAAVKSLRQRGGGMCDGSIADVSRMEDCMSAVESAERAFGPVDVLVNNAAVGLAFTPGVPPLEDIRPFWKLDPKVVIQMAQVNLLGAYQMFLVTAPGMVRRGFGKIINISTSRPTFRRPNAGPYGPLKAALEASTHIWATELYKTGVTANVLLPGGISDTVLGVGQDNVGRRESLFAAGKGTLGQEGKNAEVLPPRIMGPPIVWLASNDSNGVSGRRFVARDWDPDLPPAEASRRAMQEPADCPAIL